jgi:hypothetical protein
MQAPLTETGNLNSNTALVYFESIVGNLRTVDAFGVANLGNIITSSGVFWANGVSALNTYSNTSVSAYLPTHTGNVTAGNITVTGNIAYIMANYQNWTSNVSTISSALDQLAARLKLAGY